MGQPSPNLIFYFPLIRQNISSWGGSRYWTMIASPVPDMEGGREQSVWFRFQQVRCAGERLAPPCELFGRPQYYDVTKRMRDQTSPSPSSCMGIWGVIVAYCLVTCPVFPSRLLLCVHTTCRPQLALTARLARSQTYWYSFSPITTRWIRPELRANASGFYSNLLRVSRYWEAELAAEGMMAVELPVTPGTNGSWLRDQAVFSFVRSMISRDATWHPRYGVLPGYGVTLQDGFQDTFTSTATAALEWGAWPYARGVIDNWLRYYMRSDGMVTYRAEELAQSGRMLTIFADYATMTGDDELLLRHFAKLCAHAEWLLFRIELALRDYPDPADPRHGIIAGGDEGDTFKYFYETHGAGATGLGHKYSCHTNVYRGFDNLGRALRVIGRLRGRDDVLALATKLLRAAPRMLTHFQASLNRTIVRTGNPRAPRCVPTAADPTRPFGEQSWVDVGAPWGCANGDFRGYPELMYSGALARDDAVDLFQYLMYANASTMTTRPMTLGCTGYGGSSPKPSADPSWCATYVSYGMGYGLLVYDLVEPFLMHYFGSAQQLGARTCALEMHAQAARYCCSLLPTTHTRASIIRIPPPRFEPARLHSVGAHVHTGHLDDSRRHPCRPRPRLDGLRGGGRAHGAHVFEVDVAVRGTKHADCLAGQSDATRMAQRRQRPGAHHGAQRANAIWSHLVLAARASDALVPLYGRGKCDSPQHIHRRHGAAWRNQASPAGAS